MSSVSKPRVRHNRHKQGLNLTLEKLSADFREQKKRIVVIPRHDKTEHIHDQFQLIRKLDKLGCVIGVFDEKDLPQKIKEAYSFDFLQIKKGNAEKLINQKLKEWFSSI